MKKLPSLLILPLFIFSVVTVKAQSEVQQPTKLVYTLTVDGLTSQEQADRLDRTFKQKVGIISDVIDLQLHQIIVTTSEEINYHYVCDILESEGIKSQQYVLTKE